MLFKDTVERNYGESPRLNFSCGNNSHIEYYRNFEKMKLNNLYETFDSYVIGPHSLIIMISSLMKSHDQL